MTVLQELNDRLDPNPGSDAAFSVALAARLIDDGIVDSNEEGFDLAFSEALVAENLLPIALLDPVRLKSIVVAVSTIVDMRGSEKDTCDCEISGELVAPTEGSPYTLEALRHRFGVADTERASIRAFALDIAARAFEQGLEPEGMSRVMQIGGIIADVMEEANDPIVPRTEAGLQLTAYLGALLDALSSESRA